MVIGHAIKLLAVAFTLSVLSAGCWSTGKQEGEEEVAAQDEEAAVQEGADAAAEAPKKKGKKAAKGAKKGAKKAKKKKAG